MKHEIRAIETRYKGYRFRSRLEARWAVFFETAGIDWKYEVEGFETPFGWYLPDFYLPEIRNGVWVEVKPSIGTKELEVEKLECVVKLTGKEAIFVRDIPSFGLEPYKDFPGVYDWSAWAIIQCFEGEVGTFDCPYLFCVCPACGKIGLEYDGRGGRVCLECSGMDDKAYSYNHPKLAKAYSAAREARFEHGETP